MHWISQFQLYLFDLDGLLVNTEELHYQAYKRMLKDRGYALHWDFTKYFSIAQQDAEAPKRNIYAEFPELQRKSLTGMFSMLKKTSLPDLLKSERCPSYAWCSRASRRTFNKNVKRCVVTHSGKSLVDALCEKNPILRTIPIGSPGKTITAKACSRWLFKAISALAGMHDRVIGFEDSSRGLRSLMATPATPILVNAMDEHLCNTYRLQGVKVFNNFHEVCQQESLL